MRISISKSEVMVLYQKRVDCPLHRVRDRMKSSVAQEKFRVELLLFHIERSYFKRLGYLSDAPLMAPSKGVCSLFLAQTHNFGHTLDPLHSFPLWLWMTWGSQITCALGSLPCFPLLPNLSYLPHTPALHTLPLQPLLYPMMLKPPPPPEELQSLIQITALCHLQSPVKTGRHINHTF